MAYDGDDPENLLGGRAIDAQTGLPSGPFRAKGSLRGLTGDVRVIPVGGSAMFVDVEYETPRAILITAVTTQGNVPGQVTYEVRTGLDRAPLRQEVITQYATFLGIGEPVVFSRIVIARSLQVVVSFPRATAGITTQMPMQVAAVPIDVNVDASTLLGFSPRIDRGSPNAGLTLVIPQTVAAGERIDTSVIPGNVVTFGVRNRGGFSVYNDAAANLYLNLGNDATGASFTIIVAPGGYYEAPYNYSGPVGYAWAAAGGGRGMFNLYGFDQVLGGA